MSQHPLTLATIVFATAAAAPALAQDSPVAINPAHAAQGTVF